VQQRASASRGGNEIIQRWTNGGGTLRCEYGDAPRISPRGVEAGRRRGQPAALPVAASTRMTR